MRRTRATRLCIDGSQGFEIAADIDWRIRRAGFERPAFESYEQLKKADGVVLVNVPASSLAPAAMDSLQLAVRDLGKALLQKLFRQEGYEFTEKAVEGVIKIFQAGSVEDLFAA